MADRCTAFLPLAYQTLTCDREPDHHGPHAAMGHFDKITRQLLIDGEREHLAFDYAITWTQRLLNPPVDAVRLRTAVNTVVSGD